MIKSSIYQSKQRVNNKKVQLQKSLSLFINQDPVKTMNAQLFRQPFEMDQQKKIIQQIQDINKKLYTHSHSGTHSHSATLSHSGTHSHSGKTPPSQTSLLKPQKDPQQKYFSQQCDDLFADHHFPLRPTSNNPIDQSLFSSEKSLLLGNQFEKQIKNFPLFSTNNFSSQTPANVLNNMKSLHFNNPNKSSGYNSKSIQGRNSSSVIPKNFQSGIPKNSKNLSTNNIISKNSSQASLHTKNPTTQTKNNLNQKINLAQKNINKFIQNKQNIQASLNVPKQSSFIKQIKKKIRFQTQPDDHYICNQDSSSFQNGKQQKVDRNVGYLMHEVFRTKNKASHQNSTLECTFKPSILKKSNDIAQNLQPSFQRLTQEITISKSQLKLPYKAREELTDKKYSIKRLQQLSQPRKIKESTDREEPIYDFRPTLSKKSLSQMANCTMDVASRNKLWLEQKQAKLLKLKEEEQEKKYKKQTGPFAPQLIPYKGENEVHLSRFTKEGISSYFQRVSMAKQKTQIIEKKRAPTKEQTKEVNGYMKKKTYDEAVKELHKKILTMNI